MRANYCNCPLLKGLSIHRYHDSSSAFALGSSDAQSSVYERSPSSHMTYSAAHRWIDAVTPAAVVGHNDAKRALGRPDLHIDVIGYGMTDGIVDGLLDLVVPLLVGGVTILESGQPFSVYDFSASVASLQFSADDFITNPILPLKPGITPKQAQTQGTTGVNAGKQYFNPADFTIPTVAPTDGSNGVPPCGLTVAGTGPFCDTVETTFGNNGRNLFRAPFQNRFDFSLVKTFAINERFNLKFQADAFNIFNHPSFDAPNNNVTLNPCFNPQPCYSPAASNIGFIEDTLGSARFIQMALHLTF